MTLVNCSADEASPKPEIGKPVTSDKKESPKPGVRSPKLRMQGFGVGAVIALILHFIADAGRLSASAAHDLVEGLEVRPRFPVLEKSGSA